MTYQFVIIDEDNWAPSWREQYRRVEEQVKDDFVHSQDIEIDQDCLTTNARNALVSLIKDKYKKMAKRGDMYRAVSMVQKLAIYLMGTEKKNGQT